MSAIRSKDTRPEMVVRRFLHAHGYRYRLHVKSVPTTPDIVLRRLHTVILVNGCFWHGHNLEIPEIHNSELLPAVRASKARSIILNSECCKIPQTNREFWLSKILRNRERDERDREHLTRLGWNVIQIWECELRPKRREATLQSLLFTLSKIELALSNSKNSVKYDFDIDRPLGNVADDSAI